MEISETIKNSADLRIVFKTAGIALLLFVAISQLTAINSVILVVLSIVYIMYVPTGIGNFVLSSLVRIRRSLSEHIENIGYLILLVNWSIGSILIVGLIYILFAMHLNLYKWSSIILLALSCYSYFSRDYLKFKKRNGSFPLKILIAISLIGLSYGLFVRSFSPYPLSPGMDTFTHIYTVKSAMIGSLTNIPLVYVPTLDFLIAMSSHAFNSDVVGIFWAGSLLEFVLFSISTYIFSFWISKKHHYSFLSTIIALSVTEAGKVANLQFLFPGSLMMILFPVALLTTDFIWRSSTRFFAMLFSTIVLLALIMIHLEVGIVSVIIIVLYLIVIRAVEQSGFILYGIRVATIALCIIVSLLFFGISTLQIGSYQYHQNMFASSYIDLTDIKIHDLTTWYTPVIITSSILGLIALSIFEDKTAVVIGFVGALLLYVYFQQFANIQRIMTLERPVLSFAAATSFFMLPLILIRFVSFIKSTYGERRILIKEKFESGVFKFLSSSNRKQRLALFIYTLLIMILIFPIIMQPYEAYIGEYSSKGFSFANFTPDELDASKWVEKNTNIKSIIYSDPFTVLEMRGLAFRKHIEQIGWNTTVANLVKESLTSNTPSKIYSSIVSHVGKDAIIVISPRTSDWLNHPGEISTSTLPSEYFTMFPINEFRDYNGFNNLFDERYFHLSYRTGNVFVFTLR